MRQKTFRPSLIATLVVWFSTAAFAAVPSFASSQPSNQTAIQRIGDTPLVTLRGNTHPLAQARFDQGTAAPLMSADRLLLILKRSPKQETALQSYLQAVEDPESSSFHKFITPDEFGKLYGMSDAELRTVQAWLQTRGFTINKVNKGRTAIEFSGTVGQVQEAFNTSIHRYLIGGQQHWANAGDPSIPAALAPLVAGVASLNDFKPRPHLIRGPKATWNAQQQRFKPELTIKSGGSSYLFVGPGDAATIYNAPNTLNAKYQSTQTPYDGTGVTIGLAGDSLINFDGVINYQSLFGLPGNHFSIVYDGDYANLDPNGDDTEALLDSEISGALAPGANVVLYTAGNTVFEAGLFLAIYRAIDDNNVNILSVSFGGCEAAQGAAGNQEVLNAWEQAAAQGITVVVSTGDSGSAECDNPNLESVANNGLAVNALASTPYNIAVGGSDFSALKTAFNTYVSSTAGSNYTTALSYIPENPWNDSTSTMGGLASNVAYKDKNGDTNIVAGGGGASSLGSVNPDGSQAGYPKPGWQKQFPLGNADSVRDLPDVSLFAANGMYGAMWALCGDSDCTGSSPTISGVGGTSASAPAFAGILALINQKVGASTRLGQANWILYRLAQTTPNVFHQITTGNISVYCAAKSADCGTNSFIKGYDAALGYNFATGLGSVDITQLVNSWGTVAQAQTTTSLALDKTSFTHGDSVKITAAVAPSAASGEVAIVNNATSQIQSPRSSATTSLTLSAGTASGNYTQLPGGKYNVYANYGGDGIYAGSVSQPVQVTVGHEDSVTQFSVDAINSKSQLVDVAGTTLPLGTYTILSAQPIGKSQASNAHPATDATGTMLFNDSVAGGQENSFGSFPLDSTGNGEIHVSGLKAGAHTLTADYSGDLSYNGSTSAPVSFNIAPAATTISLTSSDASISNGSLNLLAQVEANLPSNLFQAYGSVTFTDTTSNTVLGTSYAASSAQCANVVPQCASVGLTVNVNQLAMGANSIVATYTGDSNFIGSGPSAPVTVTCSAGCSNGTGQTLSLSFSQTTPLGAISAGGTITSNISIGSGGGFAGAVNMTCTVTGTNSADTKIPTCSLNPAQVNVTATAGGLTVLTINTTAPTKTAQLKLPKLFPWYGTGGTTLAIVLLFGLPSRRLRRRALLGLVLLLVTSAWVSGCGGGGGSTGNPGGGGGGTTVPGTTPDVYKVTFHAADAGTGTVTAEDWFHFTVN